MKLLDNWVDICIQKEYITREKAPWLRYSLERRLVSMIAFILLETIGCMLDSAYKVSAFIITFCILRSSTNGYHAKTFGQCLLYSVMVEVLLLKVVSKIFNYIAAVIVLIVSSILIWFLAPYNHPNMNLSIEEIAACSRSAKIRLTMILLVMLLLHIWGKSDIVCGIIMGILLTALTLVLAYCKK